MVYLDLYLCWCLVDEFGLLQMLSVRKSRPFTVVSYASSLLGPNLSLGL